MIKPKKSIVLSIETILFTRTFAFDGHVVVLFGVLNLCRTLKSNKIWKTSSGLRIEFEQT